MAIPFSNELFNKFVNIYLIEAKKGLEQSAAFKMGSDYHKGLATEEGFITGAIPIIDRDPHATGAGTERVLGTDKVTKVSRVWGTEIMRVNATEVKRFANNQDSEKVFADFVAKSYVQAYVGDVYETALGAAVAAISNEAALVVGDGSAQFDYTLLNSGLSAFGDASNSLTSLVMRGASGLHSLIGDASTSKAVENVMGATIIGGDVSKYGRASVVYDANSLRNGAIDYVLALAAGAITVDESEQRDYLFEKRGGDNIHYTYQVQGGYDVGILGYSYKQADQDVAATRAEILTAANWEKKASSDKQTAGVLIQTKG